jgi:DNA invertase Pin-like site-specific DNA recombinase
MVWRLIGDLSTSTVVRNECHRLLIAIERNQDVLIEESVERLARLTNASDLPQAIAPERRQA